MSGPQPLSRALSQTLEGVGDAYLSGWPQRAPHQLAVFPTSEKGTCLGEGRIPQYLPGLTPLTLVICVKCTMTIALNRGRILSASEKGNLTLQPPIPPGSGLSTTPRISHLDKKPLPLASPGAQEPGKHTPLEGRGRSRSLFCPAQPLPPARHQGPTPNIFQGAQLQAPLPTSGHPATAFPPTPSSWDCPKLCPAPVPAPLPKWEIGWKTHMGKYQENTFFLLYHSSDPGRVRWQETLPLPRAKARPGKEGREKWGPQGGAERGLGPPQTSSRRGPGELCLLRIISAITLHGHSQ